MCLFYGQSAGKFLRNNLVISWKIFTDFTITDVTLLHSKQSRTFLETKRNRVQVTHKLLSLK